MVSWWSAVNEWKTRNLMREEREKMEDTSAKQDRIALQAVFLERKNPTGFISITCVCPHILTVLVCTLHLKSGPSVPGQNWGTSIS